MNKKLIRQIKQLKGLESAGKPQGSWVASNKELLMNQIQPQTSAGVATKSLFGGNFYYAKFFAQAFGLKALRPVGVFCMVLLAFLGYNAVNTMANASIPGDALYPIKTASENMQLSLASSDTQKVQLQLTFLSRRTDELQQIAKQTDNSTAKKAKIAQAMKKITSDVNTVKASMAKISMAAVSPTAIAVAKEVDDKTLKINKDIATVQASLPADIKKDVADDVKTALATTDATGAQMLTIIVKTTEVKGNTADSNQDIVSRVTERIKAMEANIKDATDQLDNVSTSTPAVSDGTTATSTLMTTSDIAGMREKIKQAQDDLDQAKVLLDKKDFDGALKKIQESKDILGGVVDQTPIVDNKDNASSSSSTVSDASSAPSVAK